VTGEPVENYLSEKLWKPLGMEADAWWSTDGAGTPIGFCCLNAVLRDYAKLGSLFLNKGMWQGKQIVSEAWVLRATRPSKPHLEPENVYGERGYQYQWWVPDGYDGEFLAMGIWGQYIWISEKDNVVIARTSVDPSFRNHTGETIAVFRELTKQASSIPESIPEG
jgi:CubicO group peptidase (beta-lactamase class C family)